MFDSIAKMFSSLKSKIAGLFRSWGTKEARITMVGLDAAGKSTMLYKLRLGEIVSTIPTIGFNVEAVEYKNLRMTVWDIGGQDKIRPLWEHYYRGTTGLIFVVDANDRDRVNEARDELHKALSNPLLADVPLLVFANKSDLPYALSAAEIGRALGLESERRKWYIQSSSCMTGDGLYEGLDFMREAHFE